MRYVWMMWAATALCALWICCGAAFADGRSGTRNTDAVVKEWVDEYEEIGKKKPTYAGKDRQLALIKGMEFGPCVTANKFLFGLMKAKKTPGDHRLYALRCLLRMADKKTFGKMLGLLSKAKDSTLWNVFGRELLVRPSGAIREWACEDGIKSRDPLMLCAYLRARTRKPDPTQAKAIAKIFAKHVKEKGNVAIAFHALKAFVRHQPQLPIPQLTKAAAHTKWQLRLAAADILPSMQPFDGEVEAATRALLQDASPIVQRAAIDGVGRYRRSALTELLITKLNDAAARTRHAAVQALQTITGQRHGHNAKAWAAWYAKQAPEKALDLEAPKYHGIEIHSDYVVFVVDASSSMEWPFHQERHRVHIAVDELKRTLGKLSPKTKFNVIVFNERNARWRKEGVLATPANTAAAKTWAASAMSKPAGDTFFYEAIQSAITDHPGCDTIFLLTDGNPTAGRYWSIDGITAGVREWSRFTRVAINTVGLSLLNLDRGRPNLTEKPAVMTRMMSAIASETGGEFKEVLSAPK